jgi:rod shape determining protein RodA
MIGKFTGSKNIDWITLSLYMALVLLGILMIYAATAIEFEKMSFLRSSAGKQATWILISIIALSVIYSLDWKIWQVFAYPLYGMTVASLVAVLLFGQVINGNKGWFIIMGQSIQPAEFAKFGTALAVAGFLSSPNITLRSLRNQIIVFSIIFVPMFLIMLQGDMGSALVFLSFLVVLYREGLSPGYYALGFFLLGVLLLGLIFDPIYVAFILLAVGLWWMAKLVSETKISNLARLARITRMGNYVAWITGALGLILIWQPGFFGLNNFWKGLGDEQARLYGPILMALVFFPWMFFQWARKGFNRVGLVTAAILVGVGLSYSANFVVFKALKPHQADRILVWLTPDKCKECKSWYNLTQSKNAISSGGFLGKGYLQGSMTRLSYVPEQPTDFIFCTVGEEHGFLGSMVVICLFLALLIRLTVLSERQRSNFARVYGYCLAGILFFHVLLNLGMTMGLMPIIGIPLPFISRGGSSLLGFSVMIGVMLKMDYGRWRL